MSFNFKRDIKTILMLPALYLGYDFLPLWFIVLETTLLLYLSLFKPIRILAYIHFIAIYFIFRTVGLMIVPETMVPILAICLVSQYILNRHDGKEEFYLSFLWLGAFAIFSSGLYYLLYSFFTLLFIFILEDGQSGLSLKSFFKSLWRYKKQFTLISVITVILFIFFPRFYQFLPSANIISRGKIGYNKEINNSTTANLQLSSQVALYAELDKKLPQNILYWRGRVLSKTDGYNWREAQAPMQQVELLGEYDSVSQKLKYEQDFNGDLILLDTPIKVVNSNLGLFGVKMNSVFKNYTKKKKVIVEAISSLSKLRFSPLKERSLEHYLQFPEFVPLELRKFNEKVKAQNPTQLLEKFQQTIKSEGWSYTLQPGSLPSIGDFIRSKAGYCSHFSALLAAVLRLNNIPARLVTGFQGGQYNNVGKFYTIKSNDAHVWVEYYDKNLWNSVDPTAYISPDRINLGGEQFLTVGANASEQNKNPLMQPFLSAKQWFDNLNYKVSLFLDNYDRTQQKSLSERLNITRKTFFFLGFVILIITINLIYFWNKFKGRKNLHPADKILYKLNRKKFDLAEFKTISQLKAQKEQFKSPALYLEFLHLYQETRYGGVDHYSRLKELVSQIHKA